MRARLAGLILLGLTLAACTPTWQSDRLSAAEAPSHPILAASHFTARDGHRLPLRVWPAAGAPRAMAIALHGFNDYSKAYEMPAAWWAARGVQVYAYDQRGFGASAEAGIWAGTELLTKDLADLAGLVRAANPGLPLYLVGESMGAAVILVAAAGAEAPLADGLILSAPAVWAGGRYNAFAKASAWLMAHTLPWVTLSGRGLKIQASDNVEMLRALGRDPLFIKETRADALWGLTVLMEEALDAAPNVRAPTLLLYGDKDEVMPDDSFDEVQARLANGPRDGPRIVRYSEGWHLLFRDLGREAVFKDTLDWMRRAEARAASGHAR